MNKPLVFMLFMVQFVIVVSMLAGGLYPPMLERNIEAIGYMYFGGTFLVLAYIILEW